MRSSISLLLAQIAAVVAGSSGCDLSSDSCADYKAPPPKTITVTGAVACQIAQGAQYTALEICAGPTPSGLNAYGDACRTACGPPGYSTCTLPADYINAYFAAQSPVGCTDADSDGDARADAASADAASADAASADAADTDAASADAAGTDATSDASAPGAPGCPAVSGAIQVVCTAPCTGRRTAGVGAPDSIDARSIGEYFATCSHFEAASVLAFERLARELAAHGAPDRLVRSARRAARDEVRHARRTRELARRFGAEPAWPLARPLPVRPLVEVALENAAEGCVRETYGAVLGLVSAARASDPAVRAAMQSIARDECRHAALSWRVAAWAASVLGPRDRTAVQRTLRAAARELAEEWHDGLEPAHRAITGMPSAAEGRRIARLLDGALFRAA